MNSFEFNKIAAGVLLALLVSMTGNLIGHSLFHHEPLEKNSYVIEAAESEESSGGASAPTDVINPIEPLLASAKAENGKVIVEKKCAQCHTFNKGEAHKIGPNLWNVVMNTLEHGTNFSFSTALKSTLDQNGGKWTFENLNHFIYKPNKFAKGTKMSFVGLKDDKERADVIAYLSTLNDNPVKLPGASA